MWFKATILSLLLFTNFRCQGDFVIPEVTLEAYSPKGFRASIPALEGIQMFAFHANINKALSQVDPGEYRQDYTSPSGNVWSYYNSDLALKLGDVVNYWVFIQYDKLGYRKDNQNWTVTELIPAPSGECKKSSTLVSGKTQICSGDLIFTDNFNGEALSTQKWIVEQYIPTYTSSDYEFVSYQNIPRIVNKRLIIKPTVATEDEVNGELDLRGSCTRQDQDQCYFKRQVYFIIPPVTSGRVVSKFKFRYGKIEIKAKLPSGDWIYPQIYLEQTNNPSRKLWIAYARGNDRLLLNNGEDLGGKLLFGGPVLNPREPDRSQYLRSVRSNNQQYTKAPHIYTVVWSKDHISLQIDGSQFGEITKETMNEIGFSENDMVQLVLGVGVGGVNDFPDDAKKENYEKPWRNYGPKQVRDFFNAKNKWLGTWSGDNPALQVEYVKIWAL